MSTSAATRRPRRRAALLVAAAAVAVNLIGAVGVPFTATESAWFAGLELPAYYPPGWAFGVVWPVLYALIGAGAALVLFGVQLVVNVAWSPVFWGLERPDLGLVVLGLLLPLVAATMVAFDRVDRRAALLLVPYLAWVCFATALNYGIWALN